METLQKAFDERNTKLNKIEKIKELKTPMSVYEKLDEICSKGVADVRDEDTAYFFKCFGIYHKKDDTFMLRLRIAAGQLSVEQAQKIGEISHRFGDDYIDITTRQQIELRFLKLEDLPVVLKELESVGISPFQTGVDNFRNIVTSSFDGLGDKNILVCKPIIDELQEIFFKKEDWIGVLPRKFNTAILGTKTNDCNIYGHDCCFVAAFKDNAIGFNLYLGGKVGIQAEDSGLFIAQNEVVQTFKAIINLFREYGFRDNRNKNRLHFLLEAVGMQEFVKAIKATSGLDYKSSGDILSKDEYILDDSGVFYLGDNLDAVHFSIPSGIFKGSDLIKAADLACANDAQIRLSVEQSFYLVAQSNKVKSIQDSELYKEYSAYHNTYFNHQIACAGTATCSFGVIPNKPDAIEMANYLQREVPLKNAKVRMYWSGCVKGCGIHGIADIGFEGCKAKDDNGNTCYGVHIFIGGKATQKAKEARILYKSVPLTKARDLVKDLMIFYKNERLEGESFEKFDTRVLSRLSVEEITSKQY
ncbi:ferredoxin--nitrite reductase [bacterium]|nr:ferredoxin--nitrite reductase [bacterium]MBU1990637.1 ferredoxin--nitrite reductase [bacterium]